MFKAWLLSENQIPQYLYKKVDLSQFQKYIDKGILPPKRNYAHYIEGVGFVKGNSFTDEQHLNRWQGKDVIKIDTSKIKNKIFPIPGHKTYMRTRGMTVKNYDPNAWKYEDDEIDEFWIEGTLNLKDCLVN